MRSLLLISLCVFVTACHGEGPPEKGVGPSENHIKHIDGGVGGGVNGDVGNIGVGIGGIGGDGGCDPVACDIKVGDIIYEPKSMLTCSSI